MGTAEEASISSGHLRSTVVHDTGAHLPQGWTQTQDRLAHSYLLFNTEKERQDGYAHSFVFFLNWAPRGHINELSTLATIGVGACPQQKPFNESFCCWSVPP